MKKLYFHITSRIKFHVFDKVIFFGPKHADRCFFCRITFLGQNPEFFIIFSDASWKSFVFILQIRYGCFVLNKIRTLNFSYNYRQFRRYNSYNYWQDRRYNFETITHWYPTLQYPDPVKDFQPHLWNLTSLSLLLELLQPPFTPTEH